MLNFGGWGLAPEIGGSKSFAQDLGQDLGGTKSAILNRESSDLESCDSKVTATVALNVGRLKFGLVILSRFSEILLCCDSTHCLCFWVQKFWRFLACDSAIVRFGILCR